MEDVKIISFIAISFVIAFFVIGFFSLNSISDKQKAKIARLKERIRELKEWYETQQRKNINQGIEIADLKDELQKARQGIRIMNYVEGMSNDYLGTIHDLATCKRILREKSERLIEVEKAFTEASLELNSVKNAIAENDDLWKLYRQTLAENRKLKQAELELKKNNQYWKERANHERHKPFKDEQKKVESDWWTPKRNIEEIFIEGVAYRVNESVNVGMNLLRLWSGNKSYTVQKADFMPCNNRGIVKKDVEKHIPDWQPIG